MAITNAQQAKQILMEDGGIPHLVKKGKGKKRPGYRGDDAAASAAICAAYGVDFLEPLKPFCPADAQEITFPFVSAIEIIVLLKVD